MPHATEVKPCPYHETPVTCGVCGARCHGGAKGMRCRMDHDDAKHTPAPAEAVTLEPPRWYDDRDEED